MKKNENDIPEKRESARIHDSFSINYKAISKEDFEQKAPFYISRRTAHRPVDMECKATTNPIDWYSLENDEDYSSYLIKIFSYLDQKMNMILYKQEEILKTLVPKQESKDKYKTGECIDISGSGIKLLTDEELKEDTILELCIEPLISPPIFIVALGKIINLCPASSKGKEGFEVSTEFIAINEDDRDELIKYTFQRQREWITSQKNK